jgi:hypothetical protein
MKPHQPKKYVGCGSKPALGLVSIILFGVVFTTGCAISVEEGTTQCPVGATQLIQKIQRLGPSYVKRSDDGSVVGLTIPRDLGTDDTLELVEKVSSLRDLKFCVNQDTSRFTQRGAQSLGALTNLATLRIWCANEFAPGVFYEIARLKGLEYLELVRSDAPQQDYVYLTNLSNLVELKLHMTPNFGDQHVPLFTNLVQLRSVTLLWTGVLGPGTNALQTMNNLTNLVVKLRPSR